VCVRACARARACVRACVRVCAVTRMDLLFTFLLVYLMTLYQPISYITFNQWIVMIAEWEGHTVNHYGVLEGRYSRTPGVTDKF
jgi:hypothetical protein